MISSRIILREVSGSELKNTGKTLGKLLPCLTIAREFWWKQTLIGMIPLLLIPVGLINPYLTKLCIDGPLMNHSTTQFLKYGAIMAAISIFTMLTLNACAYFQGAFSSHLREDITKKLYTRMTQFSLDFFKSDDKRRYGGVLGGDGVEVVVWGMEFIPRMAVTSLTMIAKLTMVFFIDWRLGVIVLAAPPLHLLRASILARKNRIVTRARRKIDREYSIEIDHSLGKAPLMKAFHTEAYHTKRVHESIGRLAEAEHKDQRFVLFFGSLMGFLVKFIDGVPALVGAILVTKGQISLGQLSASLIYIGQASASVGQLIEMIPTLAERSRSIRTFSQFLKKHPTVCEDPHAVHVDFSGADIEVRDVWFSYVKNRHILKGLNFRIEAGKWNGIKAPSGYGKTTLLNLILRQYDVQEGQILIGGTDVRKIKFDSIASQISCVLQEMILHDDTVARIISYDMESATLEEVRHAARLAGIDEHIESLPEKYATRLGADASRFSHGQRQRLMIARALLRQPKLLVMDESFGSLDKETEDRIVGEMKSRFRDMTVIVVSHHASVLEKMDRVVDLTKLQPKEEPAEDFVLSGEKANT